MHFHVLSLFPDMIRSGFGTSITGRSLENGSITLNAVNIRDYTINKHKKVDDYPYGGGAGMLMQAQPVYDAYQAVLKSISERKLAENKENRDFEPVGIAEEELEGKKPRVIYLTPTGTVFKQAMAKELAQEEDLIFLCGHYEGIDERVLEEIVTDYISIGDYVLTGGELPALVVMDAISRMVPGVLGNSDSGESESHSNYLLEYPQYSRPEVWQGKRVPEILLSGDHAKVEEWRLEQSLERTRKIRPDLYEKWVSLNEEYFIRKAKREERKRKNELRKAKKAKMDDSIK